MAPAIAPETIVAITGFVDVHAKVSEFFLSRDTGSLFVYPGGPRLAAAVKAAWHGRRVCEEKEMAFRFNS